MRHDAPTEHELHMLGDEFRFELVAGMAAAADYFAGSPSSEAPVVSNPR